MGNLPRIPRQGCCVDVGSLTKRDRKEWDNYLLPLGTDIEIGLQHQEQPGKGWEGGSVGKGPDAQTCDPEFRSQAS